MNKTVKNWIIVAVILTLLGLAVFFGVMAAYGFDFTRLSTEKHTTKTYEISEDFDKISVRVDTTDVVFEWSKEGECRVVCTETKKIEHSAEVLDGALTIKTVDNRRWYDHIGIFSDDYKITVYLPQQNYASLLINTDTGDISIPKDFYFESIKISGDTADTQCYASVSGPMEIELSTGDIKLDNIITGSIDLTTDTGDIDMSHIATSKDINIETDTGDIVMKDTLALGIFNIESDTGDVILKRCDANELLIETDTGDVKGSLINNKVFIANSNTGRVSVPESTMGGKCKITTDTGDIKIVQIVTVQ